jgi:hypothetical protein
MALLSKHPDFKHHTNTRIVKHFHIEQALQHVHIDGHYIELGVFEGKSINHIASLKPQTTIWGFDSWQGIEEEWRYHDKVFPPGSYSTNGQLPQVADNVKLVSGWFEDSLPLWLEENPGQIAYIHIDSDTYSAATTIFKHLGPRIVRGTVISFDEWFVADCEERAFKEWLRTTGRTASMIVKTNDKLTVMMDQ